jgi:hypothetical protein
MVGGRFSGVIDFLLQIGQRFAAYWSVANGGWF